MSTEMPDIVLAGVAQLVGILLQSKKVTGSIPSQGICQGCGFGPRSGCMKGNQSLFRSFSSSLFYPLSKNK